MRFSFLIFVFLFSAAYAGAQTQAEVQGRVFWRGMIDDRVHLSIKGATLNSKAVSGSTLADGVYSFTAPLPDRDVTVEVIKKKAAARMFELYNSLPSIMISRPSLRFTMTAAGPKNTSSRYSGDKFSCHKTTGRGVY